MRSIVTRKSAPRSIRCAISSKRSCARRTAAFTEPWLLRFFDQFRYDRIGIGCQLRNEVCLMSGVEPSGEGYYLVKGKGLPRIDIIGNAGRVDWPQLVTQIASGVQNGAVVR